jgi:enhancing lycopene biosynthesis protein 2
MKKVAVVLSGSGVYDGSEIHEAVLSLLAIEKHGAQWHCFAPNINQHHVINHITGEEMDSTRNVLIESARIARGNISDITTLDVNQYDALLLPGGFGAAKNLTDFAFKGAQCTINESVAAACRAFAEVKKPAGYICIAPVIIPMIYSKGVQGTIGDDKKASDAFNALGGQHISSSIEDVVFDPEHRVLSTSAYMATENLLEASVGIESLVKQLVEMA